MARKSRYQLEDDISQDLAEATRAYTPSGETDSFFGHLHSTDTCPHCGSDRPFSLRRRGWVCQDCKETVIPA